MRKGQKPGEQDGNQEKRTGTRRTEQELGDRTGTRSSGHEPGEQDRNQEKRTGTRRTE